MSFSLTSQGTVSSIAQLQTFLFCSQLRFLFRKDGLFPRGDVQHGKNLVQIKGWTKAPSELVQSLSVFLVKWESIVSDQFDHTGVCCKSRKNVVEHNSGLTQPCTYLNTEGFCSAHGTKGFVPSDLLCSCFHTQERQELQSMNQLFRRAPLLCWQCLQLL